MSPASTIVSEANISGARRVLLLGQVPINYSSDWFFAVIGSIINKKRGG
jgi:hypothetical protein